CTEGSCTGFADERAHREGCIAAGGSRGGWAHRVSHGGSVGVDLAASKRARRDSAFRRGIDRTATESWGGKPLLAGWHGAAIAGTDRVGLRVGLQTQPSATVRGQGSSIWFWQRIVSPHMVGLATAL